MWAFVFQPPGGSHNLWDLVAVIKGQDDSLLPQNYGQGIMHMKHLVRFKTVSADGVKTIDKDVAKSSFAPWGKEQRSHSIRSLCWLLSVCEWGFIV